MASTLGAGMADSIPRFMMFRQCGSIRNEPARHGLSAVCSQGQESLANQISIQHRNRQGALMHGLSASWMRQSRLP
jgi:hypothetical protein